MATKRKPSESTELTAFERKCEKVAAETGVAVYFPSHDEPGGADQYEDDGCLHIRLGGIRACFDVGHGQSLDGAEQNEHTRAVMTALGLARKIGERVLVEEEEDEDVCPTCGREL